MRPFFAGLLLILVMGCSKSSQRKPHFYYWRTTFQLTDQEKSILASGSDHTLYLRYFDIGLNDENRPTPLGVIRFTDSIPKEMDVVPVIFIKNSVFENGELNWFYEDVIRLIQGINQYVKKSPKMVQFDCDWTEKTRESYFNFLQNVKANLNCQISATIRLHQVKYFPKTGIPPVDNFVLMYYNMGDVEKWNQNSIYDRKVALSYLKFADKYPKKLDVALPIFTWAVQFREGKVVNLLNKTNLKSFADKAYFKQLDDWHFEVVKSCFFQGKGLRKGDRIKVEFITNDQLEEMQTDISDRLPKGTRKVIFYDLDAFNFEQELDLDVLKDVASTI